MLEAIAAASAAKEALWIRTLFEELNEVVTDTPGQGTLLLIDNQSAMALAKNATFHDRTKHIVVRHHFIHNEIEEGHLCAEYVSTDDQVANVLTKALARKKFHNFCTVGLGLVDLD